MMDHPTNWSPYFRDDNFGQAYDLGRCQGHQGFQDQQYNNYSNTYNEGWWDHSNYDHSGNYQEIDPYANYNRPSLINHGLMNQIFFNPHLKTQVLLYKVLSILF